MRTIIETLEIATKHFENAGVDSPRLTAEILLADTLRCNRLDLYLRFDQPLSHSEREQFGALYKRRLAREPLQYILGTVAFCGFNFTVTPSVLIPRPETEQLTEEVMRLCANLSRDSLRLLDIGTGSGCIGVTLAKRFPAASVVGLDISADAIAVARLNAERLEARNIVFRIGDIFNDNDITGQFDVIVSNPPYVSREMFAAVQPEISKYEPVNAVTDNGDGLTFYRRIAACAPALLSDNGTLALEIGAGQAGEICRILAMHGFSTSVHHDLAGIERILLAWRSS